MDSKPSSSGELPKKLYGNQRLESFGTASTSKVKKEETFKDEMVHFLFLYV